MNNNENEENFERIFYGIVSKIDNEMIYTRIYTINTNELIYYVTFNFDNFEKDDHKNIAEGAVFDWKYGQVSGRSFSDLKVRDKRILTESEKAEKEKIAKDLIDYFFPIKD